MHHYSPIHFVHSVPAFIKYHNVSKFANKEYDELLRPLNNGNLDESLWTDKCNYIDLDHCTNLNPSGLNLVVTQLNIRSLIANQSGMKRLLENLRSKIQG